MSTKKNIIYPKINKGVTLFKEYFKTKNKPDYQIIIIASVLITIGIVFSYSLSIYTVIYLGYDEFHFLKRQFAIGMFSIFLIFLFAHIKPDKLVPLISWSILALFTIAIVFMQALPSSMTVQAGGATRWIRILGFSISPVEFFKIGLVYYLAFSFNKRLVMITKGSISSEIIFTLRYITIFLLTAYFVAVEQKELGQTLVIGITIFIMLIFAKINWKLLFSLVIIAIVSFAVLISYFPHRINRIQSWWGSVQDTLSDYLPSFIADKLKIDSFNEAYQVGHSINAINNGGIFGEGISNGYIKLGFLSDVHTDFVLAGITEEIGLFGLSFIMMLFMYLIIRIFRIARLTNNNIYFYFTIGVGVSIGTSLLINTFGTSGMIPIKGLPVPLLSYGGSSLVATSIAIGLVLSISNSISKKEANV